ncbi:MAG TPA: hypothetical protein ENN19_16600 [Chloroflexi bacterium]|nr:hypothetical protein [Chloroflexota bacterium]
MKEMRVRIIAGLLLIVVGVIALLQSLGVISDAIALIWAVLFGTGGLFFLYVYFSDRDNWWAIIPGFSLLGIAAIITLETLAPIEGDSWLGAFFLASIGVAFWMIYLTHREHWWAIIPGGVLLTLAIVAGLSSTLPGLETGGLFFLGLGLTFGLVALLPTPEGDTRWALIPAGVLLVMGLLIAAAATEVLGVIWPAALIAAGLYLIYQVLFRR